MRRVAVTIRTGYPRDGMTVRQNNEAAGRQDVWHLHTHDPGPCEPMIATSRLLR